MIVVSEMLHRTVLAVQPIHSEQFKEGNRDIGTKDKKDCCLPLLTMNISETKLKCF